MKKIFKTMLLCCIILSQAQFLQAQSGESLNFANGDYVDFGNTLGNFGTGNFTFETWFKTTATNQTIISKRPACSAGNFWNVRINATGKVYFEMCENSALLNLFFAETPLSYNDGNWHHMATVRDGNQMRIIIDGYIAVSVNNSAITNINNSTSLRIGSSSCNGFVGQLDETRLWSSARSQCNIYNNRLYEYSATPTALLLNCHYNQGVANATNTSVTTLTDFSDYNNIGTLIGFNLNGTTSNWVNDGCNAQGNTSAPSIGTTTATGCNNYTWNGTTYTSSGMYTSTFNAANGCDSISTLELMIGKPVSGGNDTACFGTILKPKATTLINPVQDQSNLTYNAVANGGSPWQSFTPAINGTIRYFEAEIRTPLSGMAATVFVELYEGQGTGGTLLGTSTVKTISSTSTYAFESFDFSAQGIYLESGQLYTARLVTSSFNQAWFRLSTTNPYPNGLLNNNASQDLKFKTTMCEIKWYTAATGGTLVPNPSTASLGSTTFYAEAYDGISCYSNRTPVTLTINSPLVGSNASATAVCSGGSVILTGTGAHSYTWSNGVSNGVAFIPTTTTTFTVTGTDLKGCTNTSTRTIVVNPIPSVGSNASATTVCSGGSVILTGTGAHSYTWSNGVSNSVAFIPTTTSTFTVTGTDLNGCTNTSTQTITVNTKPIVGSNASVTTICTGESVTLNGTGANTYSWSGGITNGVAFNLSATTTFTVTATSANGCTNTSTRTILVNPLPIVGASTLETTVCPGNSVTLNGTGANTYSWSGGISNNVAFIPSTTTTYTVTGIDANGCANTSTIKIYVYLGIVSGGNDTGCVGNILTPSAQTLFDPNLDQVTSLTATSWGHVFTSYWQSFTPSVTGTLNALEFQLRTPMANTSTIVTLRIYEGEGIGGKLLGSINKLIPASSTFSFHNFDLSGNNVYLKQGQVYTARVSTNSENQYWVLFHSSNPYAGGRSNIDPNIDFLMKTYMCRIRWYNVAFGGTEIIHPSWTSIGNTTFYAQASQGASCASRVPVSLSIQAPPSINVSGVSNLCLGDTTTLTANGANTYTWMPGSVIGSTRIVSPTTTTTYTVTGADVHGCSSTILKTVSIVNPPTLTALVSTNPPACEGSTSNGYIYIPSNASYCQPISTGTSTDWAYITNVDFNAGVMNNGSGNNGVSNPFYVNSLMPVIAGSTYPFLVSATSVNYPRKIYLDLNQDGDFDDANELIKSLGNGVSPNTTITIPSNILNGTTMMRIGTSSSTNLSNITPCGTLNGFKGEYEDYPVVVSGGVSNGLTYSWSPNIALSTGTTDCYIKINNANVSTTYSVTVSNATCSSTQTSTFQVFPLPIVNVSASLIAICQGASSILTATGASTYNWLPGNLAGNIQTFSPSANTTYTITGTSADGCTNTATKNILVHANPTIVLSGLDTACNGSSTTFTVSGASTYLWMPGNLSGSTNALSPSVNTTYTVTGTGANLCTTTMTKTLHIKERIVPDITPLGDTMFCSGGSVFLYTNPFSSSAFMPTCIPTTQINTAAISASTSAANPVNRTCPSGYVAVGYKGRVGAWMDQFQLACRKVKGNGTLDSTVVYTASLGTSNGGSAVGPFLLSGNNILVGGKGWASNSISTSLSSFRGYGQNIDYILSQQSNANNPNSGALIGINANYNLGTQFALPGYVIIGVRGTNSISTNNMEFITVPFAEYFASSYTWNNGGNNSSKIVNTDGIQTVTITDANGCQSSASIPVIVLPDPQVLANASDSTICVGNSVTLSGSGAINYNWNLGVTDNDPITPHTTKTYTVTGTDAFGCTNTSNITVVVDPCGTTNTMNVKLFLQGFYIGTSTMQTALMNQGVGNSVNHVDSIQVELRASENLTNIVTTSWAVLQIDGTATVNFTSLPFGYYRIVIKHRNHLEIWSAEPVLITANSTYDFSTAANKAYGSNQVQVENGIWAFFTGDINQDGVVDGLDYNDWENDSNNFAGGYFSTDLNGDGIVDGLDFIFWEENSNNFVGAVVP